MAETPSAAVVRNGRNTADGVLAAGTDTQPVPALDQLGAEIRSRSAGPLAGVDLLHARMHTC